MLAVIDKLLELQTLDVEISRLEKQLELYPAQLQALDTREQELQSDLEAARNAKKESIKQRHAVEVEIKNLREKIGKYLNQQMQVKTNREYAAITTEIDGVKKEIEAQEDRGIQFLEEEDSADKKIAADEAGLRTAKDEGAKERARIQEQIATKQSQLKELRTERERCVSEIEAPLLERYAWLSQRYPGKAIVPVTGGNCGGCFMFMLQHRMEELRRAEEVTYCDGCQRILYLTAESEAK